MGRWCQQTFNDNYTRNLKRLRTLETIEEEIIRRLVNIYNGNLSEVAKQLEIGRSTIYRKLKIVGEQ